MNRQAMNGPPILRQVQGWLDRRGMSPNSPNPCRSEKKNFKKKKNMFRPLPFSNYKLCGSQELAVYIEQRWFCQRFVGVLFTQSRVTLQDDYPWLGFHQSSPLWLYEEVITIVMQVYSLFLKFIGTNSVLKLSNMV